jgi:hypothetical protein
MIFTVSNSKKLDSCWLLDSGATHHLSGNRENFLELKEVDGEITVEGVSSDLLRVEGIGTVELFCKTSDGTERILLEDVRYCPGAGVNLASLSRFLKRGAEIRGKGDVCELEKNGEVFLKAVEEDGLLVIQEERRSGIRAFPAVEQEKAELWHRRFCHARYETLAVMAQEELVEGMSAKAEDFRKNKSSLCEPCVLGKQVRKPFHSSKRESKEPLELIHTNVCGPMQRKTPGGNRYFVSFIDDHS